MKLRLVALLALVLAGFALAASPASAQQPIPGIKQTAAFKRMNNYVQFLHGKRNEPVFAARRQAYKTKLTNRRNAANRKVVTLFQQKVNRIKKQDDAQERRQVKQIRSNQRIQVQNLNQDLSDRLSDLKTDQNAAIQRAFDRYAPQINRRADRRARLKAQLRKTTKPARRAKLIRQINNLTKQINGLANSRNTDVNNINSRYAARSKAVTNLFNSRIAKVKAGAKRQIQQARNAWRQTFRTQFRAAKTRRDAQKETVGAVADRGFGYIAQMPQVGE